MTAELATVVRRPPTGTPRRLVLVHGFTQTSRSWDLLAERFAAQHEVVTVDAPGHGGSATVHGDLATSAGLLADAGGRATYVGYSMGGRLALHVAIEHAELVDGLVLVAATPGIEDAAARAARRRADLELASSIERDGVARFLERWLAQPLFASLAPAAAGVEDRLRNTAAGLAASLREVGTGVQASLWHRLHELTMPVLVVAGEQDSKYVAIAHRMGDAIPTATVAIVPRAGHSVHLERPSAFAAVLDRWLANQPPSTSPIQASAP